MYKKLLQALAAISLVSVSWSSLRLPEFLASLNIFDALASMFILLALPYSGENIEGKKANFALPMLGIFLFIFASFISILSTSNANDHVIKSSAILFGITLSLLYAVSIVNTKLLSAQQTMAVICLSGCINAIVCILQGQFGLLTTIMPSEIFEWSRYTGLAEHPIETGIVTSYSIILALCLADTPRKMLLYYPVTIVDFYSFKYSASMTAAVAIFFALIVISIALKRAANYGFTGTLVAVGLVSIVAMDGRDPLTSRLQNLVTNTTNYETLESRKMQVNRAIDGVDIITLTIGNGFSREDLPYGREIHNGIISSVYHFGLIGLASQGVLFWYILSSIISLRERILRAVLMGLFVVYTSGYLTGPSFVRRSMWVPIFLLASFAHAGVRSQKTHKAPPARH